MKLYNKTMIKMDFKFKQLGFKQLGNSYRQLPFILFTLLMFTLPMQNALAAAYQLKSVDFDALPNNDTEIRLQFSGPAPSAKVFAIANPARLTLDFTDTTNELSKRFLPIKVGGVQSISAAQTKDRTRLVVNLSEMMRYETRTDGNQLVLTLAPKSRQAITPTAEVYNGNSNPRETASHATYDDVAVQQMSASRGFGVTGIDFRRGEGGAGRILIKLSDTRMPIDIQQQGSKIIVNLKGADLAPGLQRRMDVVDFATPVATVDARSSGSGASIVISAKGDFSQIAYQSNDTYTVEVRPVSKNQALARKKKEITYSGDRLSLNFQSIEVRSVLQLIADFTGLNVVVSDAVRGEITLRLKDVPWDQALAIILRTQGLDKRQQGNVLYVDTAKNIRSREKADQEATAQVEQLVTLRTEIIALNYADAKDMASLINTKNGNNSILSERGNVTVDKRTNSLLVQDTPAKIDQIRALIAKLDVSVRQVLIEARIVTASDRFTHELGVVFSGSDRNTQGGESIGTDFNVSLGANSPAGTIGFNLAKIPLGAELELELSAAQVEDRAEIVASPRIITSNKSKARIEQGVEIPYDEKTSSGATNIAFKKAVLSLEVTPHITKDNRINMEISVTRDSVGGLFNGIPSIDTREIETQVLVENGQTVVLGGIFEETNAASTRSIPFLGDLPIIGRLFRHDVERNDKSELLIFVTPKILDSNLNVQ